MEEVVVGFDELDFCDIGVKKRTNEVRLIVDLLGVEEVGYYRDEGRKVVVLGRTEREGNKDMYVWLLMEDGKELHRMLKSKNKFYIEGSMDTEDMFNEFAIMHTFVKVHFIKEVEDGFRLDDNDKFHLNFTLSNRVLIEGHVSCIPWREKIGSNEVTRFSLMYLNEYGEAREMYFSVWDKVRNGLVLEIGMKLRIMGSFSLLKKERGLKVEEGKVKHAKKNKLDSYVILVQKLMEV